MGTSVYLRLRVETPVADWDAFAQKAGFHPRRARGEFYAYPLRTSGGVPLAIGKVAIDLGLDRRERQGMPGASFAEVTASTGFHSNLDELASVVRAVASAFPCDLHAAPEVAHLLADLLADLPRYYERDDAVLEHRLPTDTLDGWREEDGRLIAATDDGMATITEEEGLHRLRIGGVLRASYRDREVAMLEAGRTGWDFWNGEEPSIIDGEADEQRSLPGPR